VVTKVKEAKEKQALNLTPLVILTTLVVLAAVGFWVLFVKTPPQTQQTALLTPEAKLYVRNLALSNVEMKAAESYMKNTLVEITGNITNNGDRTLRLVEINCIFYDPYGQLVLRERVPIVRRAGAGLKPGEKRNFRLPFDSIPSTWNQTLPQLVIARIDFEN
jgi:flagellar basal body-associated protein FliL